MFISPYKAKSYSGYLSAVSVTSQHLMYLRE